MCKGSRILAGILAGGAWLSCAGVLGAADEAVSAPECAAKVCTINVFAKSLITAPCVGFSVLATYSTRNGATLIQCSQFTEPENNRLFIYDRQKHDGKAFEFDGGSTITAEGLAEAKTEGIPDKFASRPLCAAKGREEPGEGDLVFIEKRPNNSEDDPYCYRAYYVVAGASGLTVHSDEGKELTPLPEKGTEEWSRLRQKLEPYMAGEKAAEPAKPGKAAAVKSEKASLYMKANTSDASKMYLVKGDKVEVIDESKAGDGWFRIRFVTKSGKAIERWAQAQDLEVQR